MSLNFGFGEDFDEIANSTDTFAGSGPKEARPARLRQEAAPKIGQEIVFGKSGMLSVKIVDKQGKERNRHPEFLDVIILDSKFGRQQWGEVDGRPRSICSTVKHSLLQKDGTRKEVMGGWWQVPYGVAMANDRYEPVGSKSDDDGSPLSCLKCVASKLDGGCSNRGFIYVAIVGMSNEDGESVPLAKPLLATIKTPMASGISYQLYIRRQLAGAGYRPNQVVSRLTIGQTTNGLAFQLNFELVDKAAPEAVEESNELFNEALQTFAQSEEERIAAWKAARSPEGGSYAPKAAGAPKRAAAVAAARPSPVGDDDDLDF